MGHYRSEREAAYYALQELKSYVPKEWDDNGTEWGTVIYRCDAPDGGYWYTFIIPAMGTTREYVVPPPPPTSSGWREVAVAHTHPNDTGFSGGDIKNALFSQYTWYMVTQSGAYWYLGEFAAKDVGTNSHERYGTMWGQPYPWSLTDPRIKIGEI